MTTGVMSKVDERGRVIIPSSFREALGIKEGSGVLMKVDGKNGMLLLIPFSFKSDRLARIETRMGDSPGTLSRILKCLADDGIDLVRSESTAQERGRSAEWNAVADFSKCKKNFSQIKRKLMREKLVREIKIEKI